MFGSFIDMWMIFCMCSMWLFLHDHFDVIFFQCSALTQHCGSRTFNTAQGEFSNSNLSAISFAVVSTTDPRAIELFPVCTEAIVTRDKLRQCMPRTFGLHPTRRSESDWEAIPEWYGDPQRVRPLRAPTECGGDTIVYCKESHVMLHDSCCNEVSHV